MKALILIDILKEARAGCGYQYTSKVVTGTAQIFKAFVIVQIIKDSTEWVENSCVLSYWKKGDS